MNATITETGQVITGKTIKAIRTQLMQMLSVDGKRGLTAITDGGTEIHVELYDGQDYTRRYHDNTRNERQARRRAALDAWAHGHGYASWSAYETAVINGNAKIEDALPKIAY